MRFSSYLRALQPEVQEGSSANDGVKMIKAVIGERTTRCAPGSDYYTDDCERAG